MTVIVGILNIVNFYLNVKRKWRCFLNETNFHKTESKSCILAVLEEIDEEQNDSNALMWTAIDVLSKQGNS